MKRLLLGLIFSSSMLTSSLALADLAPEPCDGKAEGDACITRDEQRGTCVAVDCGDGEGGTDCGSGLECTPGATSTTGSGGSGGEPGTGGTGNAAGSPATGGSGTAGGPATDDVPPSDDGCSLTSGGSQRGVSAFAVLGAVAVGAWLSRRRTRNA